MRRLDLDRPRALAALLDATFRLLREHFAVFFTVTALVNVPVVILVDGVWGRQLAEGPDATASAGAQAATLVLGFLVSAAVTALHARIVQGLARGDRPVVGSALRLAAPAVLPAAGALLLYGLGMVVGFLLLIVPGVIVMVRWYLAPQAAVIDDLRGSAALRRSSELVHGRWWTVAGRLIAFGVLIGIVLLLPQELIGLIHQPFLYVAARAVLGTIQVSASALFGTLLFFSLRAEKGIGWLGAAADPAPTSPERPLPGPGAP